MFLANFLFPLQQKKATMRLTTKKIPAKITKTYNPKIYTEKKNINFRIKCVDRQHDNSDGYHGNSIVTVEILSVAIETSVSYPDNK